MPKVKIARKSTAIDMTAMCDVAFLLLTFFILTATARQPEPLPVDVPRSEVEMPQPDKDIATITIGKGMVFFGTKGQQVRRLTLEKMGKEYGVTFTPEELTRFSLIDSFGIPFNQMKSFIALSNDERTKLKQPGIPIDTANTANSELSKWILQARYATKEVDGEDMRISIKGDSKEEYPKIKEVIDVLGDQKIYKFSLITSLRVTDK